jgi:tetratricopeptide (TPR) repeat protein
MKSVILIAVLLSFMLMAGARAQETNETQLSASASSELQIADLTDQERIEFLHRVASAYTSEGDQANAISAYQRILEIDPGNRQARFILAHVYINAKRYSEAETFLLELIEDYPDGFQLKNNLAWLYATAEDPAYRRGERAIELAQEALVFAPYDHHVWSTLSEAYYVTGQYEKANRAIEHMTKLVMRYEKNITQGMVEGYNEQILKCKRAWEAEKELRGDAEEEPKEVSAASPDSAPAAEPAQ